MKGVVQCAAGLFLIMGIGGIAGTLDRYDGIEIGLLIAPIVSLLIGAMLVRIYYILEDMDEEKRIDVDELNRLIRDRERHDGTR